MNQTNDNAWAFIMGLLGTAALVFYFTCIFNPTEVSDGHGGVITMKGANE